MAEMTMMRSPFAGEDGGPWSAEHRSPGGNIGLHVQAQTCASVTWISTWLSGAAALEAALTQALRCTVPERPGTTVMTEWGRLLRTGPTDFCLIGDEAVNRVALLRQDIGPEVGSVTDLSHARCCIRVSGPQCCQVLGKLFVLDLRERAFGVGEVRMTGTHHVPSMLLRSGDESFDLFVFTTYARDQVDTLLDAALEHGYHVSCS